MNCFPWSKGFRLYQIHFADFRRPFISLGSRLCGKFENQLTSCFSLARLLFHFVKHNFVQRITIFRFCDRLESTWGEWWSKGEGIELNLVTLQQFHVSIEVALTWVARTVCGKFISKLKYNILYKRPGWKVWFHLYRLPLVALRKLISSCSFSLP